MLNSFFDKPFPEKDIYSAKEEAFKAMAQSRLGMTIKQTYFVKGAMEQYHLYIWFAPQTNDGMQITLSSQETAERDQKIIDYYMECFDLSKNAYQEVYVHLADFKKSHVSYCYGHAELTIKKEIPQMCGIEGVRVLADYATDSFLVECSPTVLETVLAKKEAIVELCYRRLKEHDHYNLMTLSDVRVDIEPCMEKADKRRNGIHMANR